MPQKSKVPKPYKYNHIQIYHEIDHIFLQYKICTIIIYVGVWSRKNFQKFSINKVLLYNFA